MYKILILTILLFVSACTVDCGIDCYNKAVEEKDISYCNEIQSSLKDACIIDVVKQTHEINSCEKLSGNTKDQCIFLIATNKSDMQMCDQINSADFKDNCIKKMATETLDFDSCERIDNVITKSECQVEIALETNAENCNPIRHVPLQNTCYYKWAYKNQDFNLCKLSFNDIAGSSLCIRNVARLRENQSICKEISIGQLQKKCNEIFINGTLTQKHKELRERDLAKYS